MPSVSFHLPDDKHLEKALEERVARDKISSQSKWIADVVIRELRNGGTPHAMSPDVLVELTRQLMGPLDANLMEAAMRGKNQPEELRNILRKVAGISFPDAEKFAEMQARLAALEKSSRNKTR